MMQVEELPPARESFAPGRVWSTAFHVVLSSLSLLALVVMLNYLGHRHNQRLYISDASKHKLSPLTQRVVSELTNAVKVIIFFDRTEPLFGAVANLAREYQMYSKYIDIEYVDYRMPGRAEAIRNQYKFKADGDTARVIFDCAGRVRTVLATELSEYGVTPQKEIMRTGFRGEQLFTSAILNVTQNKPVNAYFLQGHGEQGLDTDSQGYSRLAKILENNNVTVGMIPALTGTNSIPDDCGLLIVAGPATTIPTEELAKIDQYLTRGGRLFAMMNVAARAVPVGLESLLIRWNVQVGFDWVHDPAQALAENPNIIVTSHYGAHPIVRSLLRSRIGLVAPRSITQRMGSPASADAPKISELLYTSANGYVLQPVGGNRWTQQPPASIAMAVAGERGAIQGVKAERGATRFVVAGDSIFLSNSMIGYEANSDFAALAFNWLLNRDTLLNEIGPSPLSEYTISLTRQQMSQLKWLFLAVIPGLVMTFGFFVWLRRRV